MARFCTRCQTFHDGECVSDLGKSGLNIDSLRNRCNRCGGKGTLLLDPLNDYYYQNITCPACGGSGKSSSGIY